MSTEVLTFGDFRLDLGRRELSHNGAPVRLRGRALGYVAGDFDRAVTLIDRACDLNLNFAIAWYASGTVRAFRGGKPDLAIDHLTRAMRRLWAAGGPRQVRRRIAQGRPARVMTGCPPTSDRATNGQRSANVSTTSGRLTYWSCDT
jgi:hypothetical protein